jgi:general L-amino acid transport system permease protein
VGVRVLRRLAVRLRRFLASCVSSPFNIALTVVVLALLAATLPDFLRWAVLDARWTGSTGRVCANHDGACWAFVWARGAQFVYGSYPVAERWRIDLVLGLVAAGAVLLLVPRLPRKGLVALALATAGLPAIAVLLAGGIFGLAQVPTTSWGGLMLTVVLSVATIATSVPLGLVLALGRRSPLPVIRVLSIAFIEFWRGVPLIAVLFMALSVVPLLLSPGVELNVLLRAAIAFMLFNAAAMAEVFRGGLQAVPRGHYDAGWSLGLGRLQTMVLIVLPQAVAIVAPALINICISIVKETAVILIIGLFDFIAEIQAGLADPEWIVGDQVRDTGYLFAAMVYWVVCFGLSRYSALLEGKSEQRA